MMFKFIDDMVYFIMMVLFVVCIGLALLSLIVFSHAGLLSIGDAALLLLAVAWGCRVLLDNCPDSE